MFILHTNKFKHYYSGEYTSIFKQLKDVIVLKYIDNLLYYLIRETCYIYDSVTQRPAVHSEKVPSDTREFL